MTIEASLMEVTWSRGLEAGGPGHALRSRPGLAIMRRLRRAAISSLDMRTEFECLDPGDPAPTSRDPGLVAGAGLAIAGRLRRLASAILDPWTEFEVLD